jgi:mannose-6-phosphate isomerase-like protein (cupin superfamily)
MPIVNVYEVDRVKARIRDGEGECFGATAFTGDAFKSKITGVGVTIIPPGASIGDHPHGNEEEIYFVMEGRGIAELDGKKQPVKKGDVLYNVPGGTHGLANAGDEDLVIFAFCVAE